VARQAAFDASPKGKALQAKINQWDAEDAAAKQPAATPATAPAAVTKPWTPSNLNVKPGGSKEAQAFQAQQAGQQAAQKPAAGATQPTDNWKTIKGARAPAPAAPGKAGFMRNAAEYFANKTMNAAGIPLDQQGGTTGWHPGGHMATRLGQGTTAINQQEAAIASQLSREWLNQKTLNQKPSNLAPNEIKAAADLINQAGSNLQINTDNIVKLVKKTVNDRQATQQAAQQQAKNNYRNALNMKKNLEQDPAADEAEKQRMADLVKQTTEQMKLAGLGNEIAAVAASILRTQDSQVLPTQTSATTNTSLPTVNPYVKKVTESLIWSKNFDPSKQLYRRMKQGQTQ